MLFFKPEKYKGSKKGISYNILVSKREKEGKKGKREKGVRQEREKKMEEERMRKEEGKKEKRKEGRREEKRKEAGRKRKEARGKEGGKAGGEEDDRKKEGFFTFHCYSVQFSSVTQSCPILCNTMDCSMPGFPVHHQLLELAQTHVH